MRHSKFYLLLYLVGAQLSPAMLLEILAGPAVPSNTHDLPRSNSGGSPKNSKEYRRSLECTIYVLLTGCNAANIEVQMNT